LSDSEEKELNFQLNMADTSGYEFMDADASRVDIGDL